MASVKPGLFYFHFRPNIEHDGRLRKKTVTREPEVQGSSLSLHSQNVDLSYEAE